MHAVTPHEQTTPDHDHDCATGDRRHHPLPPQKPQKVVGVAFCVYMFVVCVYMCFGYVCVVELGAGSAYSLWSLGSGFGSPSAAPPSSASTSTSTTAAAMGNSSTGVDTRPALFTSFTTSTSTYPALDPVGSGSYAGFASQLSSPLPTTSTKSYATGGYLAAPTHVVPGRSTISGSAYFGGGGGGARTGSGGASSLGTAMEFISATETSLPDVATLRP